MGSQVRVDDEDIGILTQATTVRVEPGTHTVYAEREGFEPATVSITVAAGEELQVPIALEESSREGAGARSALWPESSPRADAEARFQVQPRRAESPHSHAGHVGVTARSETDLASGGTGSAFGATVGVGRYVEAAAMALIQRDTGLRIAASVWLMPDSAAKPFLRLGIPVFFGDGSTSAGFHAGGGVVWDIVPRFGVHLDIAVEHFPGAPDAREKTAGVLGAGLHARLY